MRRPVLAAVLLLVFCGCAVGGEAGTPSTSPTVPTASATGSPVAPPSVDPLRWRAILDDLAGRGVGTAAVRVVTVRDVTWNDGSLGCPEPGRMYTQALIDGQQVVVSAGGAEYDYRFGHSDRPRLCER